jgi:vitamin K-dependent gamma-carboxylase
MQQTAAWGASRSRTAGPFARTLAYLASPVDGASLALFRIGFGALMIWEVWRYFANGWIARYYIEPTYFFSYLPGIRPWPGDGMYWHFIGLGLLALLMLLGVCYRLAAWLFFLGFSYVFLLDKTNYLNHFYLIAIVSMLLALAPADRAWSLGRLLGRRDEPETVPRWTLLALRAQIVLVYFYGGIAKLNADWLRGAPIGAWIAERADLPLLGPLLTQPWSGLLFAYGGLAIDLAVGWMLLARRTFWPGALLVIGFNLTNAQLFSIGIFPFFMIATLVLFPRPDWPRRLLGLAPADPGRPGAPAAGQAALVALLALHFALQIVVPLRHWLYPSDVAWSDEGHRFSWRMKLNDKSGESLFRVVDPATGAYQIVDPADWLTRRQVQQLDTHPDMLHQFAHHLAEQSEAQRGVRPQVFVEAYVSLNHRPPQLIVDPAVDLAARPRTLLPADWILPLRPAPAGSS